MNNTFREYLDNIFTDDVRESLLKSATKPRFNRTLNRLIDDTENFVRQNNTTSSDLFKGRKHPYMKVLRDVMKNYTKKEPTYENYYDDFASVVRRYREKYPNVIPSDNDLRKRLGIGRETYESLIIESPPGVEIEEEVEEKEEEKEEERPPQPTETLPPTETPQPTVIPQLPKELVDAPPDPPVPPYVPPEPEPIVPDTPTLPPAESPPDPPPLDLPPPPVPPLPPGFEAPAPAPASVSTATQTEEMETGGSQEEVVDIKDISTQPEITIPGERKGTDGKSTAQLKSDIQYFLKTFPSLLKQEAQTYSKMRKTKKNLVELHRRIQAKLPEEKKPQTIGIIVDASKYIDERIKALLVEKTMEGLKPADLVVNVSEPEDPSLMRKGSYVLTKGRSGKLAIERSPVYRSIPSTNPQPRAKGYVHLQSLPSQRWDKTNNAKKHVIEDPFITPQPKRRFTQLL